MTIRKKCIYCNKEIIKRSSEHIIQNALGGQLESTDFCCPECNNFISKSIDAPFTTIFNPIISRIPGFTKTNNNKSAPGCTGTVLYNGKMYSAYIKNGKVVECPELARELRCKIKGLPLEIISYDFKLDNSAFKNGIAKIAFNYAMDSGVDFKFLESGLEVKKENDTINSINYNYRIIPFCPLNPIDVAIEQHTRPMLYHNLILFSQHNELWCYVDLFNTFQYYVMLSNKMPNNNKIYENYMQTVQKTNHKMPDLRCLYDPKEVMIYAQQYGVEPTMNSEEFKRRIKNAIDKKSQKISMISIIAPKIQSISIEFMLNTKNMLMLHQAMLLYMKNDEFQEKNFRTLTPALNGDGISSYPQELLNTFSTNQDIMKQYTTMKFNKLNHALCQNHK